MQEVHIRLLVVERQHKLLGETGSTQVALKIGSPCLCATRQQTGLPGPSCLRWVLKQMHLFSVDSLQALSVPCRCSRIASSSGKASWGQFSAPWPEGSRPSSHRGAKRISGRPTRRLERTSYGASRHGRRSASIVRRQPDLFKRRHHIEQRIQRYRR